MKVLIKTEKLAELMYRKGWTRKHVAQQAGIGQVTMQQICRGERNPSPPVAKKLTDALEVDFSELFVIQSD
ncbi:helix-turn-helix transcriptional regulator [Paenibacillus herberti]|nr:helix-turn-helix transcriptional regulator [Paenibacillus herberti]